MVINFSSIHQEVIYECTLLLELAHNRRVYIEIQKRMYGLPHAGILAKKLLQRQLALDGYHPTKHTHGLWKHETRLVWFLLVVDDLGKITLGLNMPSI
jgi:hypothetical protein